LRPNPERNEKIYALWREGRTIEEISLLTGIPRSTVGYYVKKFKKRLADGGDFGLEGPFARRGRSGDGQEGAQALLWAIEKTIAFNKLLDIVRKGDAKEAFYELAACKLFIELFKKYVQLTPEELKALEEAFKTGPGWASGASGAPHIAERRGRTFKEALEEITKKGRREVASRSSHPFPELKGKRGASPSMRAGGVDVGMGHNSRRN